MVLLLTQGKEEDSYRRAQSLYKTVQNSIATQQGNKITLFSASYDVLPEGNQKPICQKSELVIVQAVSDDTCDLKSKYKSGSVTKSGMTHIYLNQYQLEEFSSRIQSDIEAPKITINRCVYRNIIPLPSINLRRCDRSVDFSNLVSDLESLASKDEYRPGTTYGYSNCNGEGDSFNPYRTEQLRNFGLNTLHADPKTKETPPSKNLDYVTLLSSVSDENSTYNFSLSIGAFLNGESKKSYRDSSLKSGDDIEVSTIGKVKDTNFNCSINDNSVAVDLVTNNSESRPTPIFEGLDDNQIETFFDSPNDLFTSPSSQVPNNKTRKKKVIMHDASSPSDPKNFIELVPVDHRRKRPCTPSHRILKKKKKLDYANPLFDLEAALSQSSSFSDDGEDLLLDNETNLSGLIAESPIQETQNIGLYLKSLLSPELGGMGCKNKPFKFRAPKQYLPCTPLIPNSDTPGSLASFVVDDSPLDDYFEEPEDSDDLERMLQFSSEV